MAQKEILEIQHGVWLVILPLDGDVFKVEYTQYILTVSRTKILGPGRWTNPGHACVKTNQLWGLFFFFLDDSEGVHM
jgi:hypothetical protein